MATKKQTSGKSKPKSNRSDRFVWDKGDVMTFKSVEDFKRASQQKRSK